MNTSPSNSSAIAEPFCGSCGYQLTGLTESSKCPECGKPLVEVLRRGTTLPVGRRFRSNIRIFGMPLIDVAIGPHGKERVGRARGVIAFGDIAVGLVAIGNVFALGVVAFGGALSIGVLSLSGVALGLLAFGGVGLGGVAFGGVAGGAIATGGLAAGWLALGGAAIGQYAAGGAASGAHVVNALQRDPEAVQKLAEFSWLVGGFPPTLGSFLATATFFAAAAIALLTLIGLFIALGYWTRPARRY